MCSSVAVHQLQFARQIADRAIKLGVDERTFSASRQTTTHLGAALADAVLQAGVSYHTVVLPRIERIISDFPETSNLIGLIDLLRDGRANDYLLWKHPVKLDRFASVVDLLASEQVADAFCLGQWLGSIDARPKLLALHGIGPKTCDYLACLVGLDCVAVDRHIVAFADEAGVSTRSYDTLKASVSFAADFLGVSRRDFDSWIWGVMRNKSNAARGM